AGSGGAPSSNTGGIGKGDPETGAEAEEEICDGLVNPALKRAITATLRREPTALLTRDDLDAITHLEILDGLTTFEGFQCLSNLQRLTVIASTARDLSPLSGLSQLVSLAIGSSAAPDFTTATSGARALASSLRELSLVGNGIEDLTGLGELTALTHLDLRDNRISELSGLTGLENLRQLDLS